MKNYLNHIEQVERILRSLLETQTLLDKDKFSEILNELSEINICFQKVFNDSDNYRRSHSCSSEELKELRKKYEFLKYHYVSFIEAL